MSRQIEAALGPDEWINSRSSCAFVDRLGDDVYLVLCETDGEFATVSGPAEVFSVIALGNSTFRDDDPRKFKRSDVIVLNRVLAARRVGAELSEAELRDMAWLTARIEALLPPCDQSGE